MVLQAPIVCDWVFEGPGGNVEQEIRFDVKTGKPQTVTVEQLVGLSEAFTMSVSHWREQAEFAMQFLERACQVTRDKWCMDVEPDLEIKFSEGGTKVRVEALTVPAEVFDRTVTFGPTGITLEPFVPSDPVKLRTWVVFHNAVESLIDMNNGLSMTRGL